MKYAIFRAAKMRRAGVRGMAAHVLREGRRVPNAIEGAPPPQVLTGAGNVGELVAGLDQLIGKAKANGQRWRDNQVAAVDLLFTTSREALPTRAVQDDYFGRCLAWVQTTWPSAVVLTATIHRDETTPHLQILMAPVDPAGRFNAKALLGGPSQFRAHQDSFWSACGKPHQLERGERGSKAEHVPVKVLYQAMNAGAEPPKLQQLVELPPAPTLVDWAMRKHDVKAKALRAAEAENERRRKANNEARQQTIAQADAGRMLSPKLVERYSERYRAAVRLEKLAAQAKEEAMRLKLASEDRAEQAAASLREAGEQLAQVHAVVEHLDRVQFVRAFDQIAKLAKPAYVARLAGAMELEFVAGRSLIDQVRRGRQLTGPASSLRALQLIDEAAESLGMQTISTTVLAYQERRQQRDRERDDDGPSPGR